MREFVCTFAMGFVLEFDHVHVLFELVDLLHFGLDLDILDVFPQLDLEMLEIYIMWGDT